MKQKAIHKILKSERQREMKYIKEWFHHPRTYKERFVKTIEKKQNRSKSSLNSFYNAFSQAKNVIEKQIQVGIRIKTRNESYKNLSSRIKQMKTFKPLQTQPIALKNFDNSHLTHGRHKMTNRNDELNTVSLLESNVGSIYEAGNELLSKYNIKETRNRSNANSAIGSYTTISNNEKSHASKQNSHKSSRMEKNSH